MLQLLRGREAQKQGHLAAKHSPPRPQPLDGGDEGEEHRSGRSTARM